MQTGLNIPDGSLLSVRELALTGDVKRGRRPLRCLISSILIVVFLIWSRSLALGDEPAVEIVTQDNAGADTAQNWVQSIPRVEIYTQFHTGYDNNFLTRPQAVGAWFTNEQVTLSYGPPPGQATQLSLVTGGGAVNYLGQRTDANGFFDLSLSRRIAPRLTLNASLDAAYLSEPNLGANVGTNQFNGSYFSTSDKIWASYELTRRFSLVSSYALLLVRYQNQATAAFTDRQENTFGEQLRFDLTRTTVLTGEYRLLLVNYVTAPLDSTTQFFLAGIEHSFNRRLSAQFQAGASVRSYNNAGGSQTNPNFEGSLNYLLSRRTSLGLTGSYSVEQPQQQGVATQQTLRIGLQLSHAFTARITASLAVSYNHNENQQGTSLATTGPSFTQNVLDLPLSVRYQFNSRLAFDTSFVHSDVSSPQPGGNYTRSRYSVGLSFRF